MLAGFGPRNDPGARPFRHRHRVHVQEQGGFLERERLHRRAENGNRTRAHDASLRTSFALVVIVLFEVIETAFH